MRKNITKEQWIEKFNELNNTIEEQKRIIEEQKELVKKSRENNDDIKKQYSKQASQLKNKFNTFETKANQQIQNLLNEKKIEFQNKFLEITKQKDLIKTKYEEIFDEEDENSFINKHKDINDFFTSIFIAQDNQLSKVDVIKEFYDEIIKYKKELFGYKTETEEFFGIKGNIKELEKKFGEKINTWNEQAEDTIKKLEEAYSVKEQEFLSKKFSDLSKEKQSEIGWTTVMAIGLVVLFFTGFLYLSKHDIFSLENTYATILLRTSLISPLIYLLYQQIKKLNRAIQLRDYYSHKASVILTYRNLSAYFKNSNIEISEEKQLELLEKMYEVILGNEADKISNLDIKLQKITSKNKNLSDNIQKFAGISTDDNSETNA